MPYYKLMTQDEALLLGYLWFKRNGIEIADKLTADGYFYATVKTVCRDLNISPSTQQRLLNKLQARGYVKVRQRGMPKKRFVAINRKTVTMDVAYTYDMDNDEAISSFRENPESRAFRGRESAMASYWKKRKSSVQSE